MPAVDHLDRAGKKWQFKLAHGLFQSRPLASETRRESPARSRANANINNGGERWISNRGRLRGLSKKAHRLPYVRNERRRQLRRPTVSAFRPKPRPLGTPLTLAFPQTPRRVETDIRHRQASLPWGGYDALAPTAMGVVLCQYRPSRCNSPAPWPHGS